MTSGPRPLVDERRYVPPDLAAARELYRELLRTGTPISQARGIVAWLVTLPEQRRDDPCTDTVRRNYRRRLAALGSPPWERTRIEDTGAYIANLDTDSRGAATKREYARPRTPRPKRWLSRAYRPGELPPTYMSSTHGAVGLGAGHAA